jgi:hypothetical protein
VLLNVFGKESPREGQPTTMEGRFELKTFEIAD